MLHIAGKDQYCPPEAQKQIQGTLDSNRLVTICDSPTQTRKNSARGHRPLSRRAKLAYEHIYWDQASVLAQLGLVDATKLPVAGVETAENVLDPSLPANESMRRSD